MYQLRPTIDQGIPLAVCGMGDGYLLHALAADETQRFLGIEQPVFVLEPDPHVALHCLMIHDYAGPRDRSSRSGSGGSSGRIGPASWSGSWRRTRSWGCRRL